MNAPTNTDDVIDSRDVIARIEELQEEYEELTDAAYDAESDAAELEAEASGDEVPLSLADRAANARIAANLSRDAIGQWDEDSGKELKALLALQEQAEGYSEDWSHGATLIRDSYFKEYAQQYADDVGAINRDAAWPNTCIDWDQAASELQQDYTAVEFDGVTYWVR